MIKSQEEILNKLGINKLNKMQISAHDHIREHQQTILLSPTGSGKTLAFLLPVLEQMNLQSPESQCLIIVPSRELATQIEQLLIDMGSGFSVVALYGGRTRSSDRQKILHDKQIIIGTPGRLMDHVKRRSINLSNLRYLILDEFDKSLESGFESQMKTIVSYIPKSVKLVLTSATRLSDWPDFLNLGNHEKLDYLDTSESKLMEYRVVSVDKDKLLRLRELIAYLQSESMIIFCNYKDSVSRVSAFFTQHQIPHVCYHGDMDQIDRERSLTKFRNGSSSIMLATDLAARGLDIKELKNIIHYHLPLSEKEYTHRIGRTARMHAQGTSYILHWAGAQLPDFLPEMEVAEVSAKQSDIIMPQWQTILISGGKKDKISKSDILGFLIKKGNLESKQIGLIELRHDCAFVAISKKKADALVRRLNDTHLKKRKVRLKII